MLSEPWRAGGWTCIAKFTSTTSSWIA